MKLHKLEAPRGSRKKGKRLGRGSGSGLGKTSGKGHKGQKSRSGGSIPRGFEGGQMPLARRLPKFGFTNIFREEYEIVNLDTIARLDIEGEVSPEALAERGVIRKNRKLKVLAKGEISRPVIVIASKFSKAAAEKIQKAGGEARVV